MGRNFVFRKKGFHKHLVLMKGPACHGQMKAGHAGVESNVISEFGQIDDDREAEALFFLGLCARLDHDAFERFSFGLHADMEVVPQNFLRYVANDLPDSFLSSSGFGELRNERVPMIVPAAGHLRVLPDILPGGLERRDWTGGITGTRFAEWEDVPLVGDGLEFLFILHPMLEDGLPQNGIDGDRSTLAGGGFAFSYLQVALIQMDLTPRKRFDLRITHPCVRSERERKPNVG